MRRLAERLECDAEFSQALVDLFGVNHFGDPMFRMIWGMTETEVRLTPWKRYNSETKQFEGYYEEALIGQNQPCWILQQWEPPDVFGTPELFYFHNSDPETGLPFFEYPEFGCYKDLASFIFKEYNPATHELDISTIELDMSVIERAIPLMLQGLEMTSAQIKATRDAQEAYDNAQKVAYIADRLYDELPTFYGPTSYTGIANSTALLDRKKDQISQEWKRQAANLRLPRKGFYQGQPN